MEEAKLKEALLEVRNGNELERERLIRHYKPYIVNAVGHLCKRYITWSSDEASIGLIAFNRAIETFEWASGRTFLNYVYLLIQRDLSNYFRKEKSEHHLSIHSIPRNEEDPYINIETEASLELYQQINKSSDLIEEILDLDGMLSQFDISFEELEKYCPRHQDSRMRLIEMASEFINHQELVDELLRRKQFPAAAFIKKTGYKLKTIERHRKYLITLIMIKIHPEWTNLSTFVQDGPGSVLTNEEKSN